MPRAHVEQSAVRHGTHAQAPHVYFDWTEGNPVIYLLRYLVFGEGEIAPSPGRYSAKPNQTATAAPASTAGRGVRCYRPGARREAGSLYPPG